MLSVITPRWVVIYSNISCKVWVLICLPFSSALVSLKSKSTAHWCSFLMKSCGRSLGGVSDKQVPVVVAIYTRCYVPMNGGSFSISTFSVITNRLLRCFRGGLPTIGMVSFGPVLNLLSVLALGGVLGPSPRECLSMLSEAVSGLTTTIGGAGAALSGALYARCGTPGPSEVEEAVRAEFTEPFVDDREWLLLLLARWLRLATADDGCGRGLAEFGGGGGGAAAAAAAAFASFVLDDEDS